MRKPYKLRLFLPVLLVAMLLAACAGNGENDTDTGGETLGESAFAESAYAYFIEVSTIPRGSGNMQAISDYFVAFATARDLEAVQDAALNVLIKKPGTDGREHEPPVILQAHMDMVAEKNQDVVHDFLTDPIIPVLEGDWVTADKKTTLGADNGVGLALLLAVLDANDISHPPIEALITTDEETGMTGAAAFDVSLLAGDRFINLDAEADGVFIVSCAGSAYVDIALPVERMAPPDGFVPYSLTVKGLTGGHSGVDIHRGRANAHVLLAQTLREIDGVAFYLGGIDGGSARNAIPRESAAVLYFAAEDFDAFDAAVKQAEAAFKLEYPEDPDLSITLEAIQTLDRPMTGASTQRVLDIIAQSPVGVLSMSPDIAELVQTSNNLGVIGTEQDVVTCSNFPRSADPAELSETLDRLRAVADSAGAHVEISSERPPWPYKQDSPLRDKMAAVFQDMYGRAPSVEAIHAGLECALFIGRMPDADFISVGPTVEAAHSPDERLSFSSFNRFGDFLVAVLREI